MAKAEPTPDWWYEIAVEKPVIRQGNKPGVFRVSHGLNIYRDGHAVVLAPDGLGVDHTVPPIKPATRKLGQFWMRREPGKPWEIAPGEAISRRTDGKDVIEHGYSEMLSALGVDAVGPFDYPELKDDVKVGDSWPTTVIVGTYRNKRRIALICTFRESADGHRIDFRTADLSRQEGSWTIDAQGELVSYESKQLVVVSVVGAPEQTGLSEVTVKKKFAPKPTPPPTARQAL